MDDQTYRPDALATDPLVLTVTSGVVSPEYGITAELVEPLRRRWKVVLATGVACALVVLIWQAVAIPRYSAYAVIGAAETPGQTGKSSLGGIAGLASAAGVNLPGGNGQTSPFDQFKFLLTSPDLAAFQTRQRPMLQIAFRGAWDPERRQWRQPEGLMASFDRWFNPIFGIPAILVFDSRTLAGFYGSKLELQDIPDTELTRVVLEDPDPAHAAQLLQYLIADANEMLRRRAQVNARMQAAYLRNRLALVEVQTYRETLVALLQQQEQTLMLANGQMPYAAQRIEEINVSAVPTSKRPVLFATIAFVIGLCLGAFGVIVVHNIRRARGLDAPT